MSFIPVIKEQRVSGGVIEDVCSSSLFLTNTVSSKFSSNIRHCDLQAMCWNPAIQMPLQFLTLEDIHKLVFEPCTYRQVVG
jgi:hypothetical protein